MRTLASQTLATIGQSVTLKGWVNSIRDHGKIAFFDLRDRSGIVQVVIPKGSTHLRSEDIVEITGVVKKRPESMVNPKMPTGFVEVEADSVTILSQSKELPMPLDSDGKEIAEEVRLKYRYLDLRRPRLQRNIRLRSKFVDAIRQFLFKEDFVEIETPYLTKTTPEGSRDFVVPSRLRPGQFYALPQSPQQYKQLLMAASFERYFQMARCFRDEDLRADRGFEHTQIDIEMSFVDRAEVMKLDERMITSVVEALGFGIKTKPFPVISYKDAMKEYGADKFDMRSPSDKKEGLLAFAWVVDFPFFEKTPDGKWTFTHNPFSAPEPEWKEALRKKTDIDKIIAAQYDLVCNGYEVGGGSIRNHEPELLRSVFEVMGYEKTRIDEEFGHMLQAFSFGIPPHGGIAHGIERLLMTLLQEPYLREVVAFPQTSSGGTSVMDAPSPLAKDQLIELGLTVKQHKSQEDIYEQIKMVFANANIPFDEYEHPPVKTSKDAANVRGGNIHQGAKAILLYSDGKPVMVTVPGDHKIDMKLFKKLYSVKDLRMATPEQVLEVTSVPIGAVPPFGHIFGIPLYMDQALRDSETIAFNAGLHTKSISVKQSLYEKIVQPIVGSFSQKILGE